MDFMETQTEAVERLADGGYVENMSINGSGKIESGEQQWDPEDLVVDELIRFEGVSNPDDEAMMLAVSAPLGVRGVLVMPFGPDLSGPQADAVRLLSMQRRKP